jgi:putative ATP-dependent endonuclease of OLD family
MRIKTLEVMNYRALRDASIDLAPATVLIGENNCGKSAFLRALDLFFSGSPRVKPKDFSDDNVGENIDITVHFSDLTPHEATEFSSNLIDGELIVTRRLNAAGSKESGQFFISARVNPEFSACRNEEGKNAKKELYKPLIDKYGLPKVSSADDINAHLEAWEDDPANEGSLKVQKVAGFKGWQNVAVGKLREKTDFVFIRAMDDAEQIEGDKNSPVKALINTIAKQTIENTEKFKKFVEDANKQMAEITDPANVPLLSEISGSLTGILSRYYKDSAIDTTWEPITQIQPSFPTAIIEVKNNDFVSGIDGVGHGLQRAIVLTVLQFMAERKAGQGGDGVTFDEAQSDIILAIEEPESFQHPTKQRLFANVLRALTVGFNKTSGIRIQTISVSHSPLMVSLPQCESVRMIRRVSVDGKPNIWTNEISLTDCAVRSADVSGRKPEDAWTGEQFGAKLHTFGSELAEGFFAKCVVLVEGVGDQAILNAAYKSRGRDPYAEGFVIVEVGGKASLDKPIIVFDELGVPCFWVFDNDKRDVAKKNGNVKTNRILQRLAGVKDEECVEWPEGVTARYAAWDYELEKYFEGKDAVKYAAILANVAAEFHIDPSQCLKFPATAFAILQKMEAEGVKFDELDEIIEKVDALAN